MDENLDRAAAESQGVSITSRGFDRGWFSSEGQHRIAVIDGELRELLRSFSTSADADDVPSLIIDTRLDHGLIPLSSLARAHGSLWPGLGSAVSTLRLEFESGDAVELPGAIYTSVGVTGELQSNYLVQPGSVDVAGEMFVWSDADVLLTSKLADGSVDLRGKLGPISVESPGTTFALGDIEFSAAQRPGRFGFPLGSASAAIASIRFATADESITMGPFEIATSASAKGDRVSAETQFRLEKAPLEPFGPASIIGELRAEKVDGATLGRMRRSLDAVQLEQNPDAVMAAIETDLPQLLAAGLELALDRLVVELPSGLITAQSSIALAASDPARFSWAGALLALEATLDLSVSEEVIDVVRTFGNTANAIIGLGYLRKNGDVYAAHVEVHDGILTINGAPMHMPLSSMQ